MTFKPATIGKYVAEAAALACAAFFAAALAILVSYIDVVFIVLCECNAMSFQWVLPGPCFPLSSTS